MTGGGGNNQQTIDRAAALIVAAIARRVSGMSSTPTTATAGSTASAASGAGSAVSAITSFAGKLLAILAPISVAAAIVGAATSGMSVFLGTLKILGATLGTLLAPVFLILAAVALSVADMLQSQLLPNLAQFQAKILEFGTNAVSALEGKFLDMAVTVLTLILQLERMTESVGGVAGAFDKFMSWNPYTAIQWRGAKWLAGGGDGPTAKEDARKQIDDLVAQLKGNGGGAGGAGGAAGAGGGKGKPIPDFMGLFMGNLDTALQQMQHESGPNAQQSGLVQASMNAQMAALNMSPFEKKQLDLQQANLAALKEAVEAVKRLQPPVGV